METVSILYGKHYGDLIYVRVFANRKLADEQKQVLEDYDRNNNISGWTYFVSDETVMERVG